MSIKKNTTLLLILVIILHSWGCEDFLDEKPDRSMVIPKTPEDLETLLNNANIVNKGPSVNEVAADDYYVTTEDWVYLFNRSTSVQAYYGECLSYIWDARAMHESWSDTYSIPIYYSNVVLDVLAKESWPDSDRIRQIKGSALFYRAFAFERLAQVYAKPYSSAGEGDLGIVLRTTADISEKPVRSTVKETYQLIIRDLESAAELLPAASEYPTHPTKAAALGELARTYLSMREYEMAGIYADKCLAMQGGLLDYNDYSPAGGPVFPEYNEEVIFHARPDGSGTLAAARIKINPELYLTYADNDLRKELFFVENEGDNIGTFRFRGSYIGRFNISGHQVFHGITTAEMYLIRAEGYARAGDTGKAMADLNLLLTNRYRSDSAWIPQEAASAEEALSLILSERRKELVFRGLRWTDLRRLNEEGHDIMLSRVIDGVTYTLPPGDPRWVMLIPDEVINLSGLTQNPR